MDTTSQTTEPQQTNTNTEIPEFIDDGWNVRATIAPVPNLHRGMSFLYRPLGWFEKRKEHRQMDKITDEEAKDMKRAEQMKGRMLEWSYSSPITIQNILNLPPSVFLRAESIMNGVDVADEVCVEVVKERKN